ncbi:hypothetical protein VTO42DRAFT_8094 [Malbranchea cinnamomea]
MDGPPESTGFTKEDLRRLVIETWIRDCKEEACLDKFFAQLAELKGSDYWMSVGEVTFPNLTRESFTGLDRFKSIREELLSDLETYIPGYFGDVAAGASDNEKIQLLTDKIRARWRDWKVWKSLRPYPCHVEDGFNKLLHRTLAEKRVKELGEILSSDSTHSDARIPSPRQGSFTAALNHLRSIVEEGESSSLFSCSGSIAIQYPQQMHSQDDASQTMVPRCSAPVSIYWFSEANGSVRKLSLPDNNQASGELSPLELLIGDCKPETFGGSDRNTFDPESCCAWSLDADRFCTTFHPADFGILETIERMLLPRMNSPLNNDLQFRRVRAELYQFNIYSGPSGIRKNFINTTRSPTQFASLVVCLPSAHQGGVLFLGHGDHLVRYDWSEQSSSKIQWVAFYSDCEHEIRRISQGHRITVTYDLRIMDPVTANLSADPIVQLTTLPLYSDLRSLGLQVKVLPVLEEGGTYFSPSKDLDVKSRVDGSGQYAESLFDDDDRSIERDLLDEFCATGYMTIEPWSPSSKRTDRLQLKYWRFFMDRLDRKDIESRWKMLLLSKYPKGIGRHDGARVGEDMHPYRVVEQPSHTDVARWAWPHAVLPGITWITAPKMEAKALSYPAGDSEPYIETRYSCAAIIAIVPPFWERDKTTP